MSENTKICLGGDIVTADSPFENVYQFALPFYWIYIVGALVSWTIEAVTYKL